MGNQMVKEIISIMEIKEFIKEIGKMAKRKDSASWLSMINMDIQENGNKIKNMEKVLTSTLINKDMKENGLKTRKMARASINIEMEMNTMETGKTIEDKVKELCLIIMDRVTLAIGLRENNKGGVNSPSQQGKSMRENGNQAKCTGEAYLSGTMVEKLKEYGNMANF